MRAALALLVLGLGACGSKPCNVSYACPAGQTCDTLDGIVFTCMTSGAGKVDDRCDASPNTPPQCADGLGCLATGFPTSATCVAWCDDATPCPADKPCTSITLTTGATAKVCLPCNTSYACGAGETCASLTGATYSCMPAGASKAGDTCSALVGASITCGERLVCLAMGDPTHGACTSWCDRGHPCAAGTTCQPVLTTMGQTLQVCL